MDSKFLEMPVPENPGKIKKEKKKKVKLEEDRSDAEELKKRGRRWSVTCNNHTEADVAAFDACGSSYSVRSFETGEQGTPHIQGYLEFPLQIYGRQVAKRLGGRFHVELSHKNEQRNTSYCGKEENGSTVVQGTPFTQGFRSDLDEVRNVANLGGMKQVSLSYDYMQSRTAALFLTYNEEPRTVAPYVIWIWGGSSTGKTHEAKAALGPGWYMKGEGSKYWDGYDGHKKVIINEFRGDWEHFPIEVMLQLLRDPCRVECKFGSRQFVADQIVITSPFPPEEVYGNRFPRENMAQLLKRIDEVFQFVDEYKGPIAKGPKINTSAILRRNDVSLALANENNCVSQVDIGNTGSLSQKSTTPEPALGLCQRVNNVEDSELSFNDIAAAIEDLGL